MLPLYENIKRLRIKKGLSQGDLAKMIGYTDRSSIAKIESGKVDLPQSKIESIALALGVSPGYIMGWENNNSVLPDNILPLPTPVKKPRLGEIACGTPTMAEQNIVDYDKVPEWIECDFTLMCKGDSMTGARIFDGDIVCIRQQPEVENGEIAAVLIDDEATLKRVYLQDGRLTLMPENPSYQPLIVVGDELDNVRILGKAVYFISAVR